MDGQGAPASSPSADDILAQCAALMARQGYHGTSMRDLAAASGRSPAGLYHHFSSKEELLYLINQRGFGSLLANGQRLLGEYRAGRAPGSRPSRKASAALLCNLIGAHLGYFGSHLNEMRVLMFGTQPMSNAHGEAIRDLKERYSDCLRVAVGDYIAARREPVAAGELERKTYLLFGMMNWIFGWYSFDQHGSVDALAEEIFLTFTRGCLPPAQATPGED